MQDQRIHFFLGGGDQIKILVGQKQLDISLLFAHLVDHVFPVLDELDGGTTTVHVVSEGEARSCPPQVQLPQRLSDGYLRLSSTVQVLSGTEGSIKDNI